MDHTQPRKKKSHYRPKKRSRPPLERPIPETRPQIHESVREKLSQGTYIVFDIETTGGNPERNGITDIFAIKWKDGTIVDTFGTLINPEIPIPPIVRKMTGITNNMVRNAPLVDEVMPSFVEFVEDGILVSHNTIGDMKFIRFFAEKSTQVPFDNFFLCTHLLVEKLFPETPDKSLSGLAQYFKIKSGDLHRAEADAYATLGLFQVLFQKIKEKKFEYIDETIRFQGDMESALRLGWAVPPKTLESLPQSPGVFTLLDSESKAMLVSSAFNLNKDVIRLKTSTQLPRQILKMVLRTYEIAFEPTSSLFQAMVKESEIASDDNSGSQLHQRIVTAFTIHHDRGHYKLAVDTIGPGVLYAYGPVRDRRAAQDMIQKIALALGRDPQAPKNSGIICDRHELRLIRALFNRELPQFRNRVEKETRSIPLFFQPAKKRQLKAILGLIDGLESMEVPSKILDLLMQNGLLAVKQSLKDNQHWEIYKIHNSRPSGSSLYQGKIEDFPQSPLAKSLLQERDHKTHGKSSHSPLGASEARLTHATLWWLVNFRGDARFFLFDEIQAKNKIPDSSATSGS
jgi:DNA polymerase III epsilon subunit family exonuclease